jgi:hypothetical protein
LLWLRVQSFRHANQLASHQLHRRLRIVAFYLFHALVTCAEAQVNSISNAIINSQHANHDHRESIYVPIQRITAR